MKSSIYDIIEKAIKIIVVPICIGVGVFDILGLLDSTSQIVSNIPAISLILLSGLTGVLLFAHPEKEDLRHSELIERTSQIQEAIKAIDLLGGRVQTFDTPEKCLKYVVLRIKYAKTKISNCYSDASHNFFLNAPANVLYREVLLTEDLTTPISQTYIQQRINAKRQYFTSYVLQTVSDLHLDFIVIDNSEVIFFSNLTVNNIAVTHPQLVYLLQHYFDTLEKKAQKII